MAAAPLPAFGELLKHYRLAAGLTQEALAERAGLSVRGVSDLERGVKRTPRLDTLRLLVAALGLAAADGATFAAAARRLSAPGARLRQVGPPPLGDAVSPLPLVGRSHEVALLEQHLALGPPLLLLAGEPGIGKTRLLQEAMAHAVVGGWTVLEGGCQRRGGQEPYAPVLGALQRHIARQAPAHRRRELAGCAWLVRLLPELAEERLVQAPAWALAPEQERRLMFAAVGRFLANVAGPAGTLLVLDDLQWAGPDALDLLATLLRVGEGARAERGAALRVVGAYRDTEVQPRESLAVLLADLAHAQHITHVPLAPLTPPEVHQLLAQLLEGDHQIAPQDQALVFAQVLAHAGGVPFFVVSYAHALRQGMGEGAPRGGLPRADVVPWDVAQGIRQRVAALPEAGRQVLRVAAVAGRTVREPLLAAVAGRPEREVLAALEGACQARLLEDAGEEGYRFAHDVIRETVETDLGTARRTVLHRRLAQALEQEAQEGPGTPRVEVIAYHYAQTPEHARAAHWLERAGDHALAGFANAAALEHYTAARARLPAGGAAAVALSRVDEKLGDLRVLTGAYAQAQEDFARARAQTPDAARRAELGRKEGVTWERRGEFARALAAFAAAEAEGGPEGSGRELPGGVRAALELSRGVVLQRQVDHGAVAAAAERALALLQKENPSAAIDRAMAEAEMLQGVVAFHEADFTRAEECFRRSLALHERRGNQEEIAWSWHELGWVALYYRTDLARAAECYRRGLGIWEQIGSRRGLAQSWCDLGWVAFDRGNLGEAEVCYQRSLMEYETIGDQYGRAACWQCLGWVARERGDLAGAEDRVRQSMVLREPTSHQAGLVLCYDDLGWVALRRGLLVQAHKWFERSAAIVERFSRPSSIGTAHVSNSLGWVACEQGEVGAAARWCYQARRIARRVGFTRVEAVATLGQARALLRGAPPGSASGRHLRVAAALLARGRDLATRHGLAQVVVQAAVLAAELRLCQGMVGEAQAAAEEALQLAAGLQLRLQEAVARRLAGQCALTGGDLPGAVSHLRTALAMQTEMGTALETARTRLILAETLGRSTETRVIPDEAHTLLAEARVQFVTSGAALDLAQAEQVVAAWDRR